MTDKEKQIEDMARDICPIVYPKQCEKQCFNVGNCQELKEACEKIYNAGYRKITKDLRIVTKDIWEEHIEKREKANKIFEEQVRRETAMKILKELKEELDEGYIPATIKIKELAKQYNVEVEE